MRVKIGRKIYDTEKAAEVGKQTIGSFGDARGFEEIMFQKSEQEFFLLVKGGPESQYPEENIVPLSLEDAKEWLGRVCGEAYALDLIPTTEIKKPEAKKTAEKKTVAKAKPAAKKTAADKNTAAAKKAAAAPAKKAAATPAKKVEAVAAPVKKADAAAKNTASNSKDSSADPVKK